MDSSAEIAEAWVDFLRVLRELRVSQFRGLKPGFDRMGIIEKGQNSRYAREDASA